MIIAGMYSFKNGLEIIQTAYPWVLSEIVQIVASVDSEAHRTKVSREKTMPDRVLYSPKSLNKAFKAAFYPAGWTTKKVLCAYSEDYYINSYQPDREIKGAFREMDFVKDRVGVEVQFGKYAFMVYNVCAKMTIFHNMDHIDVGVEIVPVRAFAKRMSTGVSYFEQFVWDLTQRGTADIDIPVLILGITGNQG